MNFKKSLKLMAFQFLFILTSCEKSSDSSGPIAVNNNLSCFQELSLSQSTSDSILLGCEGEGSDQVVESISPSGHEIGVSFDGDFVEIDSNSTPVGDYVIKINKGGIINEIELTIHENKINCDAIPSESINGLNPAQIDISGFCSHGDGDELVYDLVENQDIEPFSEVSIFEGNMDLLGIGQGSFDIRVQNVSSPHPEYRVFSLSVNIMAGR